MDGGTVHRLGRRLLELSRAATSPDGGGLAAAEEAVLEDVLTHDGATVRDIARRTRFAQSHVSTSVARLRDGGLVTTAVDAADRRRTVVRPTPLAVGVVRGRGARDVEPVLRAALGDPVAVARATALLAELAALLLDDDRSG